MTKKRVWLTFTALVILSTRWLRFPSAEGALWALTWDSKICMLGAHISVVRGSYIPLPPTSLSSQFQSWPFQGPDKLAKSFVITQFPYLRPFLFPYKIDYQVCCSKLRPCYTEICQVIKKIMGGGLKHLSRHSLWQLLFHSKAISSKRSLVVKFLKKIHAVKGKVRMGWAGKATFSIQALEDNILQIKMVWIPENLNKYKFSVWLNTILYCL